MTSQKSNPLFESSDDESGEDDNVELNLENKYAQKYNDWRRKEELQKLKDKYGESLDIMSEIEDESGSGNDYNDDDEDDDDDESDSLSDDPFDDEFLRVYSALKNKDPKIYDKSFNANPVKEKNNGEAKVKTKESDSTKKLFLQEYHRKLIEEKKGITEEDEQMMKSIDEDIEEKPSGYYEDLYNIRKEIKDIVNQDIETDSDHEDDQLFSVKESNQPLSKKSNPLKTKDQFISKIWNKNKQLDKGEEFLKDFILNKKYLNAPPTTSFATKQFNQVDTHFGGFDSIDDTNEDDADDMNEKTEKANHSEIAISRFHFEEPDANVIKRYPRTVDSIRDKLKGDQEKSRRAELRDKKKKEKEDELKRLRKLKREEVDQKIQKIKDISGNKNIDLKDLDLNVIVDDENEFDFEKYDQKMQLLFGDSYYNNDSNEDKPHFQYDPEIDDHLYDEQDTSQGAGKSQKRKNKKDKKLKKDIMADDKYGIYEDIIAGDIATRFKYRMVEPNDFGLTDEEILYSDDKELNRWCSLKKTSQYRSSEQEEYDKKVYSQKTKNEDLKKKILKSFYEKDEPTEESNGQTNSVQENVSTPSLKPKKGKKRRKKSTKNVKTNESQGSVTTPKANGTQGNNTRSDLPNEPQTKVAVPKKNRKRKRNTKTNNNSNKLEAVSDVSVQRLKAYGMSNRDIKRMKTHK